jgi:molybdopterin adenylyltransferase
MNKIKKGRQKYRAAVITVSDSTAGGEREDLSGPTVEKTLQQAGIEVVETIVVPDDLHQIKQTLIRLSDEAGLDIVITTGGTGFGPRDVTPEATLAVIERQANNLAEMMRVRAFGETPEAALSRGVAGIRGKTLIVNLPGSPRAVEQNLASLLPILPHALLLLNGGKPH